MTALELKNNRKRLRLTQDELAKQLSVDRRTIINYEQGVSIPESKVKLLHILFGINSEEGQGSNSENKGMFSDDFIKELTSNVKFSDWIDNRINEANKKLQMIDYEEEKAKIRREIDKQRNPKPKKA